MPEDELPDTVFSEQLNSPFLSWAELHEYILPYNKLRIKEKGKEEKKAKKKVPKCRHSRDSRDSFDPTLKVPR